MNLLSIQGYLARGYHFDPAQLSLFHSVLHSLFDHQYLLINSTHKIDLLYKYEGDVKNHIIKRWMEIKEKNYTEGCDKKFYSAIGSKDALESYFIRLYQIIQRKDAYNDYISEFDRVAKESPENPMVIHVLGCFKHIHLSDFKTLYLTDTIQKKLTINRHRTHSQLMDYLERFIEN